MKAILIVTFTLVILSANLVKGQKNTLIYDLDKKKLSDNTIQVEKGPFVLKIEHYNSSDKEKILNATFFRKEDSIFSQIPSSNGNIEVKEYKDSIVFKMKDMLTHAKVSNKILVKDGEGKELVSFSIKPYAPEKSVAEQKSESFSSNYITIIKNRFSGFREGLQYTKSDTTYLFLDKNLKKIDSTTWPECNQSNSIYKVVFITTDTTIKEGDVSFEATANNNKSSDFSILGGDINAYSSGSNKDTTKFLVFISSPLKSFTAGINIVVSVKKKSLSNKFSINSCSIPYHVSIVGGFYASTLNNPINIFQDTTASGKPTLYADNSTSQKAIAVMAIFYPRTRDRYYAYRDLQFLDKWSICFGTKLSQDLFDDLLLGLNFEFAKGGSFAAGVHYGKHNIIAGYKDFKFGKDIYSKPFNNTQIIEQWDYGFFFGVNIDLRVITSLRDGASRIKPKSSEENE
jgi:hypothetical protein